MILGPLYKTSTTGKITEWSIEVSGNMYRTITGYVGMTLTTSAWTECVSKNIGKSNGTTPAEQAIAEAISLFNKRKELGAWEDIKDAHKITFIAPMLAKKWEDEKHRVKYPVFSQPKLDGIRCIIDVRGMWTRKGKQILSAPHIFESLLPYFEANPDLVLDGELYADKLSADFDKIISLVRKTKPKLSDIKECAGVIKYYTYDLPSCDEVFSTRYAQLGLLKLPDTCVLVPTYVLKTEADIDAKLIEYLEAGYEGQMLRTNGAYYEFDKRSPSLIKHKIFEDDDFVVVGVVEGIGKLKGRVGTLEFVAKNGKTFNAAVNGDHDYLAKLFRENKLIGKTATVKYFQLTKDGVPRFGKTIAIRDYE
jgi:DNA ligase-1